jgi:hypothetical protein
MGEPSSGPIAEFFLQHIEHTRLARLSTEHKIVNYFPYVDDILLIFDSSHTDIQTILDDFNTVHPKLKFTAEMEVNNMINYQNITIHKTPTNWTMLIYRKPIFTDTIIPCTSNNPTQHKYTTVRFLYNRLNTYNLQEHDYRQEENIIHNIMHNSFLI